MKLFEPFKLGPYQLANRIVLAPMTRSRAGKSRIPNALMAEYYRSVPTPVYSFPRRPVSLFKVWAGMILPVFTPMSKPMPGN